MRSKSRKRRGKTTFATRSRRKIWRRKQPRTQRQQLMKKQLTLFPLHLRLNLFLQMLSEKKLWRKESLKRSMRGWMRTATAAAQRLEIFPQMPSWQSKNWKEASLKRSWLKWLPSAQHLRHRERKKKRLQLIQLPRPSAQRLRGSEMRRMCPNILARKASSQRPPPHARCRTLRWVRLQRRQRKASNQPNRRQRKVKSQPKSRLSKTALRLRKLRRWRMLQMGRQRRPWTVARLRRRWRMLQSVRLMTRAHQAVRRRSPSLTPLGVPGEVKVCHRSTGPAPGSGTS
mmetsp:Transcript_63895/g.140057  ORF Transcript_63895/g.140057 Transcript_63895/m.140057 type:complete len:286 (+) Transcript_63895:375-1232(+)